MRANDPLWEMIMRAFGCRQEDAFWRHTLERLAEEFDVRGRVIQETVCVDPNVQWSHVGDWRCRAAIRLARYAPIALLRRVVGRDPQNRAAHRGDRQEEASDFMHAQG